MWVTDTGSQVVIEAQDRGRLTDYPWFGSNSIWYDNDGRSAIGGVVLKTRLAEVLGKQCGQVRAAMDAAIDALLKTCPEGA